MARGGAQPGAGRPARKSANTSPVSARARARARVSGENQRPWPADKVERWAIDRLIPYAKNARTHTDAQVAAIAASIKEWGWTTPRVPLSPCRTLASFTKREAELMSSPRLGFRALVRDFNFGIRCRESDVVTGPSMPQVQRPIPQPRQPNPTSGILHQGPHTAPTTGEAEVTGRP